MPTKSTKRKPAVKGLPKTKEYGGKRYTKKTCSKSKAAAKKAAAKHRAAKSGNRARIEFDPKAKTYCVMTRG